MSILKALEKKRTEELQSGVQTPTAKIVPFDSNGRRRTAPPDMLAAPDFTIGNTSSAFIGQPDLTVGTALPNRGSELTAGAKLNAESLTHSASKVLPDFVSWPVDAERVEPRLVAITHPNSNYC